MDASSLPPRRVSNSLSCGDAPRRKPGSHPAGALVGFDTLTLRCYHARREKAQKVLAQQGEGQVLCHASCDSFRPAHGGRVKWPHCVPRE